MTWEVQPEVERQIGSTRDVTLSTLLRTATLVGRKVRIELTGGGMTVVRLGAIDDGA